MRISVQSIDTTCTGRIINGFWYDAGNLEQQHWDLQKREIISRLNQAKRDLIVNVIAFVVGGKQQTSAKQLEEIGFKCVADYHNYKYPEDSKNLMLYSMDMNDWEIKEIPVKKENPFSVSSSSGSITYSHPTLLGWRGRNIVLEQWCRIVGDYIGQPTWIDVPDQLMESPPVAHNVDVKLRNGTILHNRTVNSLAWNVELNSAHRIISFKPSE